MEALVTPKPSELTAFQVFIRFWLPVLLYVTVIVTLSAQPNLTPPFTFRNADKAAHIAEYGLLGLLLARACRASLPRADLLKAALLAVAIGVAIGAGDEVFQSFIPGRESSVYDLMADTVGVLLAQIAMLVGGRD